MVSNLNELHPVSSITSQLLHAPVLEAFWIRCLHEVDLEDCKGSLKALRCCIGRWPRFIVLDGHL